MICSVNIVPVQLEIQLFPTALSDEVSFKKTFHSKMIYAFIGKFGGVRWDVMNACDPLITNSAF